MTIKNACDMISYCSSHQISLFFLQWVSITPKLSSKRILLNYPEKSSPPHSPNHLVVSALLSSEATSVMKSSYRLRMLYQTGQQTRMVFSELVSEPAWWRGFFLLFTCKRSYARTSLWLFHKAISQLCHRSHLLYIFAVAPQALVYNTWVCRPKSFFSARVRNRKR